MPFLWISFLPARILLRMSLSCTFFEDNEAVIKMISKGRSQTMRHESRPHRVALDRLFDRISMEPKIQIKYVDTKNQLVDILTKESFSRDEWNHLLRLFNILSFSMFSVSHFGNFLSDLIEKQSAMSKRGQEATSTEGSPMAKPRPMVPAMAKFSQLGVTQLVEREGKSSTRLGIDITPNPEVESSQATGKSSKFRFLETV